MKITVKIASVNGALGSLPYKENSYHTMWTRPFSLKQIFNYIQFVTDRYHNGDSNNHELLKLYETNKIMWNFRIVTIHGIRTSFYTLCVNFTIIHSPFLSYNNFPSLDLNKCTWQWKHRVNLHVETVNKGWRCRNKLACKNKREKVI